MSSFRTRSSSVSRCFAPWRDGRIDEGLIDCHGRARPADEVPPGPVRAPVRRPGVAGRAGGADRRTRPAIAGELAARSLVLVENDGILPLDRSARAGRGHRADREQRPRAARRLRPPPAHGDAPGDARAGATPSGFPLTDEIVPDDELAGRQTILDAIVERHARCATSARPGDRDQRGFRRGARRGRRPGAVQRGCDPRARRAVRPDRRRHDRRIPRSPRPRPDGSTAGAPRGRCRDRDAGRPGGRQRASARARMGRATLRRDPACVGPRRGRARAPSRPPSTARPTRVASCRSSVPRHVGQVPVSYRHHPTGGRSNPKGDYVDGPATPLWPFGFGRSYTTFALADLALDRARRCQRTGRSMSWCACLSPTPVIAPVTRSCSSTRATRRPPSRDRCSSCAGSGGSAWRPGERRTVSFRLSAPSSSRTRRRLPAGHRAGPITPVRRDVIGGPAADAVLRADGPTMELDGATSVPDRDDPRLRSHVGPGPG